MSIDYIRGPSAQFAERAFSAYLSHAPGCCLFRQRNLLATYRLVSLMPESYMMTGVKQLRDDEVEIGFSSPNFPPAPVNYCNPHCVSRQVQIYAAASRKQVIVRFTSNRSLYNALPAMLSLLRSAASATKLLTASTMPLISPTFASFTAWLSTQHLSVAFPIVVTTATP